MIVEAKKDKFGCDRYAGDAVKIIKIITLLVSQVCEYSQSINLY